MEVQQAWDVAGRRTLRGSLGQGVGMGLGVDWGADTDLGLAKTVPQVQELICQGWLGEQLGWPFGVWEGGVGTRRSGHGVVVLLVLGRGWRGGCC